MLTGIAIQNFKLYRKKTIFKGFKVINVLTGINGRGKSTLLHALLLPKQSLLESQWNNKLVLNGQYVNLGNAIDVRNEKNSRSLPIGFDYYTEDGAIELQFGADSDTWQKLPLTNVNGKAYTDKMRINSFVDIDKQKNPSILHLLSDITYIAAERKGPQLNYVPAPEHGLMDAMGEYAPSLLSLHKDDAIEEDAISGITDIFPEVDEVDDKSLAGMVNFWMSRMFGHTEIEARYVEEANVYVLQIGTYLRTKASKPTNVGFGYSYVLPIIVAGLTSKKDDIVIVENPEAHLHPMAQSMLGKFMAWIAQYRGVQLFVETHSEHIVNSFRVLVAQQVISPEELEILFFDEYYDNYATKIIVDDNGHIEEWPTNFFDQEEKDLEIIV